MGQDEFSRFLLTTDELRFILGRLPELSLPDFLSPGELDVTSSDESEDAQRSAFEALQARAIISEDAEFTEPDLSSAISPVLVAALGFHGLAKNFFDVKAWTETESSRLWLSLNGSLCAGFRVISNRRPDAVDAPAPAVELTLLPIEQLTEYLIEPVPADPQRVAPASAVVGLVESRSIIEAFRRGEPAVAASIAKTFHCEDSLPLLAELAGSMENGFKVLRFDHEGRCVFSGDWFRGETGWLKMGLIAPPGGTTVTARSLTDGGRISIARSGLDLLRADLLALVVSLAEVQNAA